MTHGLDDDLPLVTLGFGADAAEIKYTDWEYLLDHTPGFHVAMHVTVAAWVRGVALAITWCAILTGAWLLWQMIAGRREAAAESAHSPEHDG